YTTTYHTPQFVSQGSSSSNLSISYPINDTLSTVNHNAYIASAPQIDYAPIAHHPSEFSSPDTGLVDQEKHLEDKGQLCVITAKVKVIWLSSAPNLRGSTMQNGSRTKYF
nr:hypothetical protein [Tanacetum cinerariifolium]